MFGVNVLILIWVLDWIFYSSFTCQTFDRACLFETNFIFFCYARAWHSLVDDALSQNLVSSCLIAGAGVAESRRSFSLLFLLQPSSSWSMRVIILEITKNIISVLILLNWCSARALCWPKKKVILINVTMLVLSVFSVHPRPDKNDVDDDDSVVWGGEPSN